MSIKIRLGGNTPVRLKMRHIITTSTGSSNASIKIKSQTYDDKHTILNKNEVQKNYVALGGSGYLDDFIKIIYTNQNYYIYALKPLIYNGTKYNAEQLIFNWAYTSSVNLMLFRIESGGGTN